MVENPHMQMACARMFATRPRSYGPSSQLAKAIARDVPLITADCPGGSSEGIFGAGGLLYQAGKTDDIGIDPTNKAFAEAASR